MENSGASSGDGETGGDSELHLPSSGNEIYVQTEINHTLFFLLLPDEFIKTTIMRGSQHSFFITRSKLYVKTTLL